MSFEDDQDSTRGVTLQELLRRLVRAELAEHVRSMVPARVERVDLDADGNLKSVDCLVLVKDFHRDETGKLVVSSVPVIPHVPVAFLTAGGFTFTVPLVAGETTGALLFSDRSLDRWLTGTGGEVDPEIYTRSGLSDAVFVPGLEPFGAARAAAPADHATAGSVAGPRIHFRGSTITLGDEAGSKPLVLDGDTVDLGTLAAAFNPQGAMISLTITPPGGGAPVVLSVATPGPFPLSGRVVGSATQAKGK